VKRVILNVSAATVSASAVTEAGVGAMLASMAATVAGPLLAVVPMGADVDSVQFAAALNAAGAALIGASASHSADRQRFAVAQDVAAATYTATDLIDNAALAL
jgi:hypothetical protein